MIEGIETMEKMKDELELLFKKYNITTWIFLSPVKKDDGIEGMMEFIAAMRPIDLINLMYGAHRILGEIFNDMQDILAAGVQTIERSITIIQNKFN